MDDMTVKSNRSRFRPWRRKKNKSFRRKGSKEKYEEDASSSSSSPWTKLSESSVPSLGEKNENNNKSRTALLEKLPPLTAGTELSVGEEDRMRRMSPKDLLEEMKCRYAADQILEARDAVDALLHWKNSSTSEEAEELLKSNEEEIMEIIKESDTVRRILSDLDCNDSDKWTLSTERDGVTVHYRPEPGSPFYRVRTKAIYSDFQTTDFVKFVSLFFENDLMPRWFPGNVMKSNTTLAHPSRYSKIIQAKIQFPRFLPISNRDAVVLGRGYQLPSRNAIIIINTSIHTPTYCPIPPPDKGTVRIHTDAAFYLSVITDQTASSTGPRGAVVFQQIGHDDFKLKNVPSFLLNYVAKGRAPFEIVFILRKIIRNFNGSPWEQRIHSNPLFYHAIQAVVNDVYNTISLQPKDNQQNLNQSTNPSTTPPPPPPTTTTTVTTAASHTQRSLPPLAHDTSSVDPLQTTSQQVLSYNKHYYNLLRGFATLLSFAFALLYYILILFGFKDYIMMWSSTTMTAAAAATITSMALFFVSFLMPLKSPKKSPKETTIFSSKHPTTTTATGADNTTNGSISQTTTTPSETVPATPVDNEHKKKRELPLSSISARSTNTPPPLPTTSSSSSSFSSKPTTIKRTRINPASTTIVLPKKNKNKKNRGKMVMKRMLPILRNKKTSLLQQQQQQQSSIVVDMGDLSTKTQLTVSASHQE